MDRPFNYPIQNASIKKGNWRFKKLVQQNSGLVKLIKEEVKFSKQIKQTLANSQPPSKTHHLFPKSKLIGYGWEWAVYELPNQKVVKVPAGIFPEVNTRPYLNNTKHAYEIVSKYLGEYVIPTIFERRKTKKGMVNLMFQEKLRSKERGFIDLSKISDKLRKNLLNFSRGILIMLDGQQWIPQATLYPPPILKPSKKYLWKTRNIIIKNEKPVLFDFTFYYDPFRLYPQRTKFQILIKKWTWKKFIKDLQALS